MSKVETGTKVQVTLKHLKAYGYRGKETSLTVLGSKEDMYSNVYTLEDSKGEVVYGVLEEDLKELK